MGTQIYDWDWAWENDGERPACKEDACDLPASTRAFIAGATMLIIASLVLAMNALVIL